MIILHDLASPSRWKKILALPSMVKLCMSANVWEQKNPKCLFFCAGLSKTLIIKMT